MELINTLYILLLLYQVGCLGRLFHEARKCGWSHQSRWILYRVGAAIAGVMILTSLEFFFGVGVYKNDGLFRFLAILALVCMTLLIRKHLPIILDGMSDNEVGEELNIRKQKKDEK